jgi:alpha-beta hydrolase superfamily lysophospholipase
MREPTEAILQGPDGLSFRMLGWPSSEPSRTVLVIHHGLGEHIGRYQTFARELADVPVHLFGYDARGHGQSGGKPGDAAGLDELAGDLQALLPELLQRSGAERIVLFGHSMGAAVVGHYLTTREPHEAIVAVALSAPPVRVDKTVSMRIKLGAGRLLTRIAPSLTLANEIDSHHISSVPEEVERYLADPLVHDRLSVRMGLSLVDDGPRIIDNASRIALPGLLYQGLDDGIVDIEGTRALARAWGYPDVELHEFDGLRHEAHHEHPEGVKAVFEMWRSWLAPRLEPR